MGTATERTQPKRGKAASDQGPNPNQQNLLSYAELQQLKAEREVLMKRMTNGGLMIEENKAKGEDVTEWVKFWGKLDKRYKQVEARMKELGWKPNGEN
jgi:hypothetical protein